MTALGLSLFLLLQGHFLAGVMGCVGTWKELGVEAGKAARGLPCSLCRSRYFLRSTSVFPQKVSGLLSVKYHLLTKPRSPLASEHLTLFFRLNVEENGVCHLCHQSTPLYQVWFWLREVSMQSGH